MSSKTTNTKVASSNKSSAVTDGERGRSSDNSPMRTRTTAKSIAKGSSSSSSPSPYTDAALDTLEKRLLLSFNDILSEKLKDLKADITKRIDEVAANFDNKVDKLRSANEALQHKLEAVQQDVEEIHRLHRLNDVVITGIPEKAKENVSNMFQSIASLLQHPVSPHVDVFRMNKPKHSKNIGAPIIVKFCSRNEKRAFFRALKAHRNAHGPPTLNKIDAGFSSQSTIYINDSLTRNNHNILREARRLRSEGKLFSVSTRNGHVYVKRGKEGDLVKISKLEKLYELAD